jgi:uncharacterized peroxidase-related enzyme
MSMLPVLTLANAPDAIRPTLEAVKGRYGFVPNLIGVLANAPAALEAYLTLAGLLDKSSLTPAEQQVVAIAISRDNNCGYCVAAHSKLAGAVLDQASIRALREGQPLADPKLDALAGLARAIVASRGWVDEVVLQRFHAAGYQPGQVLDVLVGVAMKTLSNYTNHLVDTPLDLAFDDTRWQRSQRSAA